MKDKWVVPISAYKHIISYIQDALKSDQLESTIAKRMTAQGCPSTTCAMLMDMASCMPHVTSGPFSKRFVNSNKSTHNKEKKK